MTKLLLLLSLTSMPFLTAKANDFVSDETAKSNNVKESYQVDMTSPATYILQVSSNLGCDYLDVNLTSKKLDTPKHLRFTKSAYSSIKLPQGDYSFGDVKCSLNGNERIFDILSDKISSFSVLAGEMYFGGRLIFQKAESKENFQEPKALKNCTQLNSRARGESSNECRDGVGVKEISETQYQINAYAPDVTDNEIEIVRSALSMSENQLHYLPIEYETIIL